MNSIEAFNMVTGNLRQKGGKMARAKSTAISITDKA